MIPPHFRKVWSNPDPFPANALTQFALQTLSQTGWPDRQSYDQRTWGLQIPYRVVMNEGRGVSL